MSYTVYEKEDLRDRYDKFADGLKGEYSTKKLVVVLNGLVIFLAIATLAFVPTIKYSERILLGLLSLFTIFIYTSINIDINKNIHNMLKMHKLEERLKRHG